MTLKVNEIASAIRRLSAEKMIEGDFVKSSGGGESRNVAADAVLHFVGADHHSQRIPTNNALNAAFHFLTAGEWGLLNGGNRILIWSSGGKRKIDTGLAPGMQG